MYKYGFEWELFYTPVQGHPEHISLPPVGWPVDGMPGLIELRSTGGKDIYEAFGDITEAAFRDVDIWKCAGIHEHTFTPDERRQLRKRNWVKDQDDVQNLYGKKPRALGNKTIASFQINVSDQARGPWTYIQDGRIVNEAAKYQLVDVPRIVRALDVAFAAAIKQSGRQPGEYCIKGDRLEYRSLPNSVVPSSGRAVTELLRKIKSAVEGG